MSDVEETQKLDRFAVNAGRARPKYTPRALQCLNCGAPVKLFSEQAVQAICDACGSILQLSEEEQVVSGLVNKSKAKGLQFPLLTEFLFDDQTYKITARLVYKDSWDDLSYDYFLFNPFFGGFWLSSYKNNFTCSKVSHVMPCVDPFSVADGEKVKTHDGKVWIKKEEGTQKLMYVDGALPWQAKIGDTHQYVELQSRNTATLYLEAERSTSSSGSELELALVTELTAYQLKQAIVDDTLLEFMGEIRAPESKTPARILAGVSLMAALWFFLALFSSVSNPVGEFELTAQELNSESLSSTFYINDTTYPVEIEMYSSLDNAWMYLTWAIVESSEAIGDKQTYEEVASSESEDKMVHIGETEISYYHGYEGGENWTEGSRTEVSYVLFPKPGHYRIMAKAVSGKNENESSARHSVIFTIAENERLDRYYLFMFFFSLCLAYISRIKLKDMKLEDFVSDDD